MSRRSTPRAISALVAVVLLMAACAGQGSSGVASPASPASTASASPTVIPLHTALPAELSHDDVMRLFAYDHSQALDVQMQPAYTDGDALVSEFTYRDMSGKRDRGILVLPKGSGPFGAAMYMAGGISNRGEFLSEAVFFAGHGIAGLLLDYPELYAVPTTDEEAVTETIFEMREFSRLFDWLAARPDIDPKRLGVVGVSYGGVRAGLFAGVEGAHLKIAILMSAAPSYKVPAMAPFDPIRWAPYVSPGKLYVQEGTQDTWFTHDEAEALIAAAHEPKKLVWYEANHGLNAQATDDYRSWLIEALGKP